MGMWKESGIVKNRKWKILLAVEVLLLIVGISGLFRPGGITAGTEQTDILLTEGIPLKAGVYEAKIYYEAESDGGNRFGVTGEELYFRGLLSNSVTLFSDQQEAVCQFYLTEDVSRLKVYVEEMEKLKLRGVEITSSAAGSRIFIFLVLLFSLLINTVMMVYLYHRKNPFDKAGQAVLTGVPLIVLCASLPLLVDYIIEAPGIIGNLAAIERVSRKPLECADYGNVFLLLPAAFRKIGFSMNAAYRLYVLAVNVLTAEAAYLCVRKGFGNRLTGLLGCALYTLNPWRISCIYERADVGVYTAVSFAPVVIYGLYQLFGKRREGKGYGLLLTVIGVVGMGTAHAVIPDRFFGLVMAAGILVTLGGCILVHWLMMRGKQKLRKACLGTLLGVSLLISAYQTNQILMLGHPLWVYSMWDMENADTRGLDALPAQTYGMK